MKETGDKHKGEASGTKECDKASNGAYALFRFDLLRRQADGIGYKCTDGHVLPQVRACENAHTHTPPRLCFVVSAYLCVRLCLCACVRLSSGVLAACR